MEPRLSLGYRPRGCRRVKILGVRANWDDYTPEDKALLARAERVLYPTKLYARPLEAAGKSVFPSSQHYYYLGDKIRQTTLFHLLGLSTPQTRVFYHGQAGEVFHHFKLPFIAKIPRGIGQGQGVYLINTLEDWKKYLTRTKIAYVQEYLALERDLRVVTVAGRPIIAYWRYAPKGDFRCNLAQGAIIDFSNVPEEGVDFAVNISRQAGFDDVGLDVCFAAGRWQILEANMHYGLQGLKAAGASLSSVLDQLIDENVI